MEMILETLQRDSTVLSEYVKGGKVTFAGAYYHIGSGKVDIAGAQ